MTSAVSALKARARGKSRDRAANNSPARVLSDQQVVASTPYSWLGEKMRLASNPELTCMVGCGGFKCKFCNPVGRFKFTDFAVEGLYSNWISRHFLACSRPSTDAIEKYNIVQKFLDLGIRTLVNMQMPGEHSKCGYPLEPSGFSYDPQVFMNAGLFYYNFAWPDFGTPNLNAVLDAVQVIDFALREGKVAVHCHAGKGRTGCIIACHLVYMYRLPASAAILYVRRYRHTSIQTRGQVMMVKEFENFLRPHWLVFSTSDDDAFTLDEHLANQRIILHGHERRQLKFIPKVIHVACATLLSLAGIADEADSELANPVIPDDLQSLIDYYFSNGTSVDGPVDQIDESGLSGPGSPLVPSFSGAPHARDDTRYDVDGIADLRDASVDSDNSDPPFPVNEISDEMSTKKMRTLCVRRGSISAQNQHSPVMSASMDSASFVRSTIVEPCSERQIIDLSELQFDLNCMPLCWQLLCSQKEPNIVYQLILHWFWQLREPVMTNDPYDPSDSIRSLRWAVDQRPQDRKLALRQSVPVAVFHTLCEVFTLLAKLELSGLALQSAVKTLVNSLTHQTEDDQAKELCANIFISIIDQIRAEINGATKDDANGDNFINSETR